MGRGTSRGEAEDVVVGLLCCMWMLDPVVSGTYCQVWLKMHWGPAGYC